MQREAAICPNDRLVGRRASTRHRLDMAARLVAAQENLRVQLEDISATGVCLRLMHPRVLVSGRVCWLNFASFGRVVWQHDLRCGLMFDDPLTDECLHETLAFADLIVKDATDKYGRLASAWVHGPGDW